MKKKLLVAIVLCVVMSVAFAVVESALWPVPQQYQMLGYGIGALAGMAV